MAGGGAHGRMTVRGNEVEDCQDARWSGSSSWADDLDHDNSVDESLALQHSDDQESGERVASPEKASAGTFVRPKAEEIAAARRHNTAKILRAMLVEGDRECSLAVRSHFHSSSHYCFQTDVPTLCASSLAGGSAATHRASCDRVAGCRRGDQEASGCS